MDFDSEEAKLRASHKGETLKQYSINEKLEYLEKLQTEWKSIAVAVRKTGIDGKRFREWRKQKPKLLEQVKHRSMKRLKGAGRPMMYPELDAALLTWFQGTAYVLKYLLSR